MTQPMHPTRVTDRAPIGSGPMQCGPIDLRRLSALDQLALADQMSTAEDGADGLMPCLFNLTCIWPLTVIYSGF